MLLSVLAFLGVVMLLGACAPTAAPPPTDQACEAAPAGFVHGFTDVPSTRPPAAEGHGVRVHWVRVHGVRVHWVRGGHGPPIVLVHGFPETWATWRPVMSRLAQDHTVVAVDLRGVGCSSLEPDGYDTDSLADDLSELTSRLGLSGAAVVGHDMGAMTAYAWARARPGQVTRLVLTGAGLPGLGLEEGAPPHVAAFAADPTAVERDFADDPRGFLTRFVGDPAVTSSGALDAALRAYSPPGRMAAALRQYQALPRDAAVNRDRTGPFPPSLALDGGASGLTLASLRRAGAPVVGLAIPGAGHYTQVDAPEAYAAAVEAFVR